MAGLIPQNFIDDVLARTDIVELIGSSITLRKAGKNYLALCPFHNEKSPSFNVSATKQFYHCFGCGVSGNAISFVMEYERLDFVDAIEMLATRLGLSVPRDTKLNQNYQSNKPLYGLLENVAVYFQQQLRQSNQAIDYLKSRGLTGDIAKTFGLGFAPEGWDHVLKQFGTSPTVINQLIQTGLLIKNDNGRVYDRFRQRIIFPIRDRQGRIIGFGGRIINPEDNPKYLNSPETPIFHKGQELYGFYEMRQALNNLKQIIIVEGYMDVIALAQQHIHYAVATLGTALSAEHCRRLFRTCQDIVFCFDGDRAGRDAAWRSLVISLPHLHDGRSVKFLFLPNNEDPDSYVRHQGKEKFEAALESSTSLLDFFYTHLSQNLNLADITARAKLAETAKPLIQQLPDGVYKHHFLAELAKLTHMPIEKLTQQPTKKYKTALEPPDSKLKPMRIALALLLQNPDLITEIKPYTDILNSDIKGMPVLKQMIELLNANPKLTTANLLEHWRNTKLAPHMNELATWALLCPETGVRAEFIGALERLQDLVLEQQIAALFYKMNQQGLNQVEKQLLEKLIKKEKVTK